MKVTKRGQVTIPKWMRDKLGINSSTEVEWVESEGAILLVKKGSVGSLHRFRGIARTAGLPRHTDEFLRLIRDGEES